MPFSFSSASLLFYIYRLNFSYSQKESCVFYLRFRSSFYCFLFLEVCENSSNARYRLHSCVMFVFPIKYLLPGIFLSGISIPRLYLFISLFSSNFFKNLILFTGFQHSHKKQIVWKHGPS